MPAKKKRKYGKSTQTEVKREMHRMKKGTAKSGRGGKNKVKSRKQAVAIALSKARKKGKKVPKKKSSKRTKSSKSRKTKSRKKSK